MIVIIIFLILFENFTLIYGYYYLTTIGGRGSCGSSGDGFDATNACIEEPQGIWGDPSGNIYIAEFTQGKIRKIDTNGIITLIAGTGTTSTAGVGGPALSTPLDSLVSVYGDVSGTYLYIGSNNFIFRYAFSGAIISRYAGAVPASSTFAGDTGQATSANFYNIKGIYLSSTGTLLIADSRNHRVRQIAPNGIVATFAGNGVNTFAGDGSAASMASLNRLYGVWADSNLNTFIADRENHRMRVVRSNGIINTIAGTGIAGSTGDTGPAALATLNNPADVKGDSAGNLYITELSGCRIRKVDTASIITTVLGTSSCTAAITSAQVITATTSMADAYTIWVDSRGVLYVPEYTPGFIRQVNWYPDPTLDPTFAPTFAPTAAPTLNIPSSQPSSQPSRQPSRQPSGQPTRQPTTQPTSQPSRQPTAQPSAQPSGQPSGQPSSQPTTQPSVQPSNQPSTQPSRQPTGQPSGQPSYQPSMQPSSQPSGQPSIQPSSQPSSQPSLQPTGQPSRQPTAQPSMQPSSQPSGQPTLQPSTQPSRQPTGQPSNQPSIQPSAQPTSQPSGQPSRQPSGQPSIQPSSQPSAQPSNQPTGQPSRQPTSQPSIQPSRQPSGQPSFQPSRQPSSQPSEQPTDQPSGQPSCQPSRQPTMVPTSQPSRLPSSQPTSQPSISPTCQPSETPSSIPTSQPTAQPSNQPSTAPSRAPSSQPSRQPSTQPTTFPTSLPSTQPTSCPTTQPTTIPSSIPTAQPSGQPSVLPTSQPSRSPSSQPTSIPSSQPSTAPTTQPSSIPSVQPTIQPTSLPSIQPSNQPTSFPSTQPTAIPSSQPSVLPTAIPTSQPSSQPSGSPTSQPSRQPSSQPSCQPTVHPSSQPSRLPSGQPTRSPTNQPSGAPTTQPSTHPTAQPSDHPTSIPSSQPTINPTTQPSSSPTSLPSTQPTRQPSRQPTGSPSSQPTSEPSMSYDPSSFLYVSPLLTHIESVIFPFGSLLPGSSDSRVDFDPVQSLGKSYILYGRSIDLTGISNNYNIDCLQCITALSSSGVVRDSVTRSMTAIGDVNRDGYQDLLVGDPTRSQVYLYSQLKNFDARTYYRLITFVSDNSPDLDEFGWSVGLVGDMNRNGKQDLFIGAMRTGCVYVLLGGYSFGRKAVKTIQMSQLLLSAQHAVKFTGNAALYSVSSAGDFNGDGYADIIVSFANQELYLIYGKMTLQSLSLSGFLLPEQGQLITTSQFSFAGTALAGIGDINGDQIDDLLIGSNPYQRGYTIQYSYILYGRRNTNTTIELSLNLSRTEGFVITGGGFLGMGLGDVDGDGFHDLLITQYYGWIGKGNTYLLNYPDRGLLRTLAPSRSPTISPTSNGSSPSLLSSSPTYRATAAPTISRTISPTRLPTRRPTTTPTRIPSYRPSRSPTRSPTVSPSRLPTYIPTISIANPVIDVNLTTNGSIRLPDGNIEILFSKQSVRGSLTVIGSHTGQRIYRIPPQNHSQITIESFLRDRDIIDLTLFAMYFAIEELSYQTIPLRLQLLPSQQVLLQNIHNFTLLTAANFRFREKKDGEDGSSDTKSASTGVLVWDAINTLFAVDQIVLIAVCLLFLVLTVVCNFYCYGRGEKQHTPRRVFEPFQTSKTWSKSVLPITSKTPAAAVSDPKEVEVVESREEDEGSKETTSSHQSYSFESYLEFNTFSSFASFQSASFASSFSTLPLSGSSRPRPSSEQLEFSLDRPRDDDDSNDTFSSFHDDNLSYQSFAISAGNSSNYDRREEATTANNSSQSSSMSYSSSETSRSAKTRTSRQLR